jgi:hypothetical protein
MEDDCLTYVPFLSNDRKSTFYFTETRCDRFAELIIMLAEVLAYYGIDSLQCKFNEIDFTLDHDGAKQLIWDLCRGFQSNGFVVGIECSYYPSTNTVNGLYIDLS